MICPPPQQTFTRVACTVVITDTGPGENFEVNVGFHKGSADCSHGHRCSLQREIRNLPSELISSYGTNDGGTGWCEWRYIIIGKGLEVTQKKYIYQW